MKIRDIYGACKNVPVVPHVLSGNPGGKNSLLLELPSQIHQCAVELHGMYPGLRVACNSEKPPCGRFFY